jgi:hypothetical protein
MPYDLAVAGSLDWPADFQMFSSEASSYCGHPSVENISLPSFRNRGFPNFSYFESKPSLPETNQTLFKPEIINTTSNA